MGPYHYPCAVKPRHPRLGFPREIKKLVSRRGIAALEGMQIASSLCSGGS
ncbi:hypothetical protein QWZ13_13690 [Reinekea marina]|nr:hypothetical protein [Reinekea marina]MDN3649967.1 hypothetical protein [Reinekea marina]